MNAAHVVHFLRSSWGEDAAQFRAEEVDAVRCQQPCGAQLPAPIAAVA
jgi:hypothetical protein